MGYKREKHYDVTRFGAKPDGLADCVPAFDAAFSHTRKLRVRLWNWLTLARPAVYIPAGEFRYGE